jgi:hypothetical protein
MKVGYLTSAVCLAILVTGCSKPGPDPSSIHDEPSAIASSEQPQPQPTAILNFALGSFIDPSTYAVGGQGSEFTQNENLYGVIDFVSVTPGDRAGMRIVNTEGKTEVESVRTIENAEQKSINFDLGVPKNKNLPSGTYKIEVLINEKVSLQSEIVIK